MNQATKFIKIFKDVSIKAAFEEKIIERVYMAFVKVISDRIRNKGWAYIPHIGKIYLKRTSVNNHLNNMHSVRKGIGLGFHISRAFREYILTMNSAIRDDILENGTVLHKINPRQIEKYKKHSQVG